VWCIRSSSFSERSFCADANLARIVAAPQKDCSDPEASQSAPRRHHPVSTPQQCADYLFDFLLELETANGFAFFCDVFLSCSDLQPEIVQCVRQGPYIRHISIPIHC
jgi:hypothetical protein